MFETITTALDDGVLTLTLNRPDRLNTFNVTMGAELAQVFTDANDDDAVRVIVVTGAGRAFCAGADISGGADSFGEGGGTMFLEKDGVAVPSPIVPAILACLKPSIAAINGAAVGLGVTMTLPMDIRLAASNAKIGFVFARRGLVPEAGALWLLPRLVGMQQALRWCYSGGIIDGAEAFRGGLVMESLAPEDLLPRAHEIAREIVEHTSPVAVALTRKLMLRYQDEPDIRPVLDIDARLNRQLGMGADVKEGVQAFLDKRPPRFPGKVSKDMPEGY